MKFRLLLLLLWFAAACLPPSEATLNPDTAVTSPPEDGLSTSEPALNPFSPGPADQNLTRGSVFTNEASLIIRESFPPQISLSMAGDLPTPCHQLRVGISSPDAENKILVDSYSVVNPDMVCIQVLEPFDEQIDLGTFPSGHYSVWLNGELVGEFDT